MHKLSALAPLALALSLAPATAQDHFATGSFQTTAVGVSRGFDITGRAMIVRTRSGGTEVYTQVLGLNPDTAYASHVHDLPCDVNAGGGHYKKDPTIPTTQQSNELWPALMSDANGVAFGFDSDASHVARPEAQSVVVHDTDGARIACADLLPQTSGARVTRGRFEPFPGSSVVPGVAQMVRSHGTTFVTAHVSGLQPNTAYPAHVHELPCGVSSAGGHYKIDPTITTTDPTNEIWPMFTTDAMGVGSAQVSVSHLARPEAQSVVIHDPVTGAKRWCADLSSSERHDVYVSSGAFITTPAGTARGFDIRGTGVILRSGFGRTTAQLRVRGIKPRTDYTAHVHDLPCRLGGGGHYKIDPTIPGTVEANELWLDFRSTRSGRGFGFAARRHTARPEAQSIIIHDTDGTRIACCDLDG